jgi:hypothetical protein
VLARNASLRPVPSAHPWAPPGVQNVALTPLSATEWRVSDPRKPGNDAGCLLGFIQRDDERYEVTMLKPPGGIRTTPTLRDAIELFSSST